MNLEREENHQDEQEEVVHLNFHVEVYDEKNEDEPSTLIRRHVEEDVLNDTAELLGHAIQER